MNRPIVDGHQRGQLDVKRIFARNILDGLHYPVIRIAIQRCR